MKRLGFAILVVGLGTLATHWHGLPTCGRIELWLAPWGNVAPLGFVLLFIAATVLFVPGTILSVTGGVLFGPWVGTLLVSVGSVLGAVAAFLLARYGARRQVEAYLLDKPWFRKLQILFADHGFQCLLFLRLSPIFPFNGLNYASGLLPVSLRDYVITSAIGMLPGTFVFVYGGHALGCAALDRSGMNPEARTRIFFALLALSLLSLLPLALKRIGGRTK